MLQQSEWPWQWRALLLLQTSTHSNCLVHWTICWEQTQVVQHCFNFSKIGLHREVSGRAFMSEAMSTVLQGRPIHWFLPDQAILRVFFRSSRASSSSGNFPSVQKKNPLMRHRDCPSMEKQRCLSCGYCRMKSSKSIKPNRRNNSISRLRYDQTLINDG